jgi:hypothetical protein
VRQTFVVRGEKLPVVLDGNCGCVASARRGINARGFKTLPGVSSGLMKFVSVARKIGDATIKSASFSDWVGNSLMQKDLKRGNFSPRAGENTL